MLFFCFRPLNKLEIADEDETTVFGKAFGIGNRRSDCSRRQANGVRCELFFKFVQNNQMVFLLSDCSRSGQTVYAMVFKLHSCVYTDLFVASFSRTFRFHIIVFLLLTSLLGLQSEFRPHHQWSPSFAFNIKGNIFYSFQLIHAHAVSMFIVFVLLESQSG
ncbi:hypothetical protein HanIR_Chr05g0213221 [Helianthus annuus]|nr:hypothetical protein HanIR_Chr05g0213221 [Helianthus annuus]